LNLEGPWKKRNLADFGVVTQCIAPQRVNDQYLTNVLLKINAKVCYFHCLVSFFGKYIYTVHLVFRLLSLIFICCAAWWLEFYFRSWTCSFYPSCFESSHHRYWHGRVSWLPRADRHSINCSGNCLGVLCFGDAHLFQTNNYLTLHK